MSFTVIYKLGTQKTPFTVDDVALQAGAATGISRTLQARMAQNTSTSLAIKPMAVDTCIMTTAAFTSSESHTARQRQASAHKSKAFVTLISSSDSISAASTEPTTPGSTKPATWGDDVMYSLGHFTAGIMSFIAGWVSPVEAKLPSDNEFSNFMTGVAVLSAGALYMADSFASKDPVKSEFWDFWSKSITIITLGNIVVFNDIAQGRLIPTGHCLLVEDSRSMGAKIDSILVIPSALITPEHVSELFGAESSVDKVVAFVGELSNLASYVARTSYSNSDQLGRHTSCSRCG